MICAMSEHCLIYLKQTFHTNIYKIYFLTPGLNSNALERAAQTIQMSIIKRDPKLIDVFDTDISYDGT